MFREELSKIQNIILYGPDDPNLRTSIVSFNIKGIEFTTSCRYKLEKQNIVLAVREIIDTKIVRASPHFFNTESQMLES